MTESDPIEQRWRTGSRVKLNVYRSDTPMFQCHTPEQAAEVVELLNTGAGVCKAVEILERIMTLHWDMAACQCWVCVAGRAAGCRPRQGYPTSPTKEYGRVEVHRG